MPEPITINGTRYEIQAIPLQLIPHTNLYSDLSNRKPKTVEEANEIGNQIKEVSDVILSKVVKPTPKDEDKSEIFSFLMVYTANAITERTKSIKNKLKNEVKIIP